jgi:hypothetical protein
VEVLDVKGMKKLVLGFEKVQHENPNPSRPNQAESIEKPLDGLQHRRCTAPSVWPRRASAGHVSAGLSLSAFKQTCGVPTTVQVSLSC